MTEDKDDSAVFDAFAAELEDAQDTIRAIFLRYDALMHGTLSAEFRKKRLLDAGLVWAWHLPTLALGVYIGARFL